MRVFALLGLLACLAPTSARSQSATLVADTAVSSARASSNYGPLSNLYVSRSSTALLRFDLGTLPAATGASQVSRATLRLFLNRVTNPGVITVQPVNGAWAESAVTAQTVPAFGTAVEVFAATDESQYVTVDVTALVQTWLASPAKNFGLALSATAADVVFDSKENDATAHPAQLEIALASAANGGTAVQGPKGDKGDTGATGATGPRGEVGATGPQGAQGLQGPQGPRGEAGSAGGTTGPQGPKGDKGETGAAGPQGAKGEKGDTGSATGGLGFKGAWALTALYAANDVVTYNSAAWVSLAAGNRGNTPGNQSSSWALLVPAAVTAVTSADGVSSLSFAGAYTSSQTYGANAVVTWQSAAWVSLHGGNHGNTPDTSAQDWSVLVPAGNTSTNTTTVINGLLFAGAYASATSYTANQVVTWQGAAWVSLHDSNHGNTPNTSAADWSVLVPASTGTNTTVTNVVNGLLFAGVYASTTNYTTNQVVTWQSAAWVSLHDGNRGNTPNTSTADWSLLVPASNNPASITTVVNGLLFDGAYASLTNYAANHVVTRNSAAFVSLHDSNHGNTPGESPNDWAVLVPAAIGLAGPQGLKGDRGEPGPQGERGYTGDTGAAGERGAIGATGRAGFTFQGTYSSIGNYAAGDVVVWQGGSWASLVDGNHGNTPDSSPLFWGALTARGLTGDRGETGPAGPQGLQGPAGQYGSPGERGLTGPVGSTGPQGAPGRDGTQGLEGERGPVGAQGLPGPVGLTWQGTYASLTNYATNDAVAWNGQTWLSLHNGNHGNTPEFSPADWTLLAAAGAIGSQGPQGVTGPTGPQGNTGAQGIQGVQGVAGTTGPIGEPGMLFRGVYSSAQNYALRDAVTFAGGTWLSLQSANHGNTPDQSPAWWQQVAAPGLQGPTGAAGIQGIAGPAGASGAQGPAGAAGPQGQPVHFLGSWSASTAYLTGDAVFFAGSAYIATSPVNGNPPGVAAAWSLLAEQGATGTAGPHGIQGPAGATGATGANGPAGATGSPGLRWMGAYAPGSGYAPGDAVSYGGSAWISLSTPNSGNTPGTTSAWGLLAAAGVAGPAGPGGSNGTNGSNGSAATVQVGSVTAGAPGSSPVVQNSGTATAAVLNFTLPAGATGAAGTAGLTYRGTWAAATGYSRGDVVYRSGSSYVSQINNNTADPAVSVANATGEWSLLASQGGPGAATVSIGTVSSGASAAVTNSGTQNAAVLNFTLPKGDTGPAGPAGLVYLGTWNAAVAYSAGNAALYSGSTYVAIASSTGVRPVGDGGSAAAWSLLASQGATGATGPTGNTGAAGTAPTIAVSATHTGAAGTQASVINVGSATAIQLDFTIPQGTPGATGAGTGSGVYSTVHTVAPANAGLQIYSPFVDGHAGGDINAILGWLPATCNVATVQVYNPSATAVNFEIHTGTPGNMAVTAAGTCSARSGTTTCTGPGTLGSGSFMSFGITGAAAVSTYLYTQFTCN